MKEIDTLVDVGLKPAEAKVYLALLDLGESAVQAVAHKAGLQRPNCYSVLEALRKKGLVSLSVSDRGRRYVAENPKRLKQLISERLTRLDEALPILESSFRASPSKPIVRYYEGRDNIYQLYEEILKTKEYACVYSPEFLVGEMNDYLGPFGELVAKRKIKMREIITGNYVPEHYGKVFHEPLQQVRFMSPDKPTQTEFIIYGDKLALLAYRPTNHALVIEGSDIIQTMRLLFEELWKHATKKRPQG